MLAQPFPACSSLEPLRRRRERRRSFDHLKCPMRQRCQDALHPLQRSPAKSDGSGAPPSCTFLLVGALAAVPKPAPAALGCASRCCPNVIPTKESLSPGPVDELMENSHAALQRSMRVKCEDQIQLVTLFWKEWGSLPQPASETDVVFLANVWLLERPSSEAKAIGWPSTCTSTPRSPAQCSASPFGIEHVNFGSAAAAPHGSACQRPSAGCEAGGEPTEAAPACTGAPPR